MMKQQKVVPYPKIMGRGIHAKYINLLAKVAADISAPVSGNARLSACLVYKGDIIGFGVNESKTHPFQAKYSKNKESVFLHAETAAIKNALRNIGQFELEKSTLYVCRVKYTSFLKEKMVFGLAKPCPGCFRCINAFNIKKVVFSLDNTGFDML